MNLAFKHYTFILIIAILVSFSCNDRHSKTDIEAALKMYDRLIKKMDGDSIAMLYAPDGDLDAVAHGRDSIRKFLSSFKGKGVSVLYVASTSDDIQFRGDTAFQVGHYKQTALINNQDTAHLKGKFSATWIWIRGEGWRIKYMATQPE